MPDPGDPSSPRLLTTRLLLRPLRESDRGEVVRVLEVSHAHFARAEPTSRSNIPASEWFDRAIANADAAAATGTGVSLAALLREPDPAAEPSRIAALLNINNIVRGAYQNAAAGWRVSVDCANRGLATEAVTALLDFAFAPPTGQAGAGLGLHRVEASIAPDNAPSLRVAEKCGFRREGLAVKMLHIAGEWRDHVCFAKLADEHRPGSGSSGVPRVPL